MDLGSFIQGKLNDFKNTVANAAQGIGNYFTQPQIQSPIPQSQSMVPPSFNSPITAGGIGNTQPINWGNLASQQAQNYFQGKNVLGQQQPFNLMTNPFAAAPRVNMPQINTGNPVGNFAANLPGNMAGSILNAPSDIQRAGGQDIQDIRSGQITQPGTAIRDVASTALPIATLATLGGGTLAKGVGQEAIESAGQQGLLQTVKQGALSGAKYGGLFGILQGLATSNQLPKQLIAAGVQGTVGAATGGVLGAGISAGGYGIGQVKNSLTRVLQNKYGASPDQANAAVQQYARDQLGRFSGGKTKQEPFYYGDLNESLGLPRSFDPQSGFVKLPGANEPETGGDKGLAPEDIQKYGQDLDTPQGKQELVTQYQKGVENKTGLDQLLSQTAQDTGARPITNLKNPDTAVEKVVTKRADGRDYNLDDLNDIARGRLVYPDKGELYKGLDVLKQNAQAQGVQVGKESDFFKKPEDGYQGYHVDLTFPNGQTEEVQLHTEKSLAASLATHDFHAQYGDEEMPAQAEKVKSTLNHEIMDAPNAKAQSITQQIEQKNAPVQAEAQQKALQTAQGIPEPLPWEKPGEEPLPGFNKDLGVEPATIPPPQQPEGVGTPGTASINPKLVAQQARLARSGSVGDINFRAQTLANQMNQVLKTPEDNLNIRLAIENPEKLNEYANQSDNPTAFKQVAKQYSDFTDYVANQMKEKGGNLNYINDYFTHIWDLSTPQAQQTYQDLMAANAKNFQSGFTKERLFSTLQDGLNAGLQLKNPQAAQDVIQYAHSMGTQVGASALNQKINELRPGGTVPFSQNGTVPYNYQGRLFQQSNVPGNQGTFIDPEIQQELRHYNPSALADNPILAGKDVQIGDTTLHIPGIDQLNQILKTSKLALGGFHPFNTSLRMAINNPFVIPSAIRSMFDTGYRNQIAQQAIDDGVIDFATKHGMTLSQSGDVLPQNASLLDTLQSKNPIAKFNNAVFGGMINTYKLNLARSVMEQFPQANTDSLQAEQAKNMMGQINDLMGGINYEELGRNKTVQQALRLIGLAPDFSEGTVRQLFSAINPKGYIDAASRPASIFALRQVIGQVALYATLSEIGRRLVTGNFSPTIQSFIQNSILKPNIPLPNNAAFNSPKTGKTQAAFLPSSEFSTMAGAFNDPAHFLQARGSGVISAAGSLLSGKDYYGNPLVNPFNGTPDNLQNRAAALLPNQLPIPVQQVLKATQSTQVTKGGQNVPLQTPAVTALNIAGLRVGSNPADPQVAAQNQYFTALNIAANSLNPNDQKTFLGVLHPTTKDANGNPVVDKTALTKPATYDVLLNAMNDPKSQLWQTEVNFEKSQPNHDPFWDWSPAQQKAYMQAVVIQKNDPGGDKATYNALYGAIPQALYNQRTQFFNSLAASGQMAAQPPSPYKVQEPQAITDFWSQYFQQPAGSATRKAMLSSALGQQALALTQQQTALTNQQRLDMGLPLLPASSSSGGYSSGGGTSAQNYLARELAYSVSPQHLINSAVRAPLRGIVQQSNKFKNKKFTVKAAKGIKAGTLKGVTRGSSKLTVSKAPRITASVVTPKKLSVAKPSRVSLRIPKYRV